MSVVCFLYVLLGSVSGDTRVSHMFELICAPYGVYAVSCIDLVSLWCDTLVSATIPSLPYLWQVLMRGSEPNPEASNAL